MRPSILQSFWLVKHQGAMQERLPVSRSSWVKKLMAPAIPKSMIFTFFSSLFTSRMFSSFRSRCIRLFWWQYFIPLTICLKNTCAVFSLKRPSFSTYLSSSPPCRNSMIMATYIFLSVRQLWTLTMFQWLRDFSISASTKMLSISLTDPMFYVFIIFIANFSPVWRCLAKQTFPKPPSPNLSLISYSPKQFPESKSSPFVAQSTALFFTYLMSSSKYSAPSELNSLIWLALNIFLMSLIVILLCVALISQGFFVLSLVSYTQNCI